MMNDGDAPVDNPTTETRVEDGEDDENCNSNRNSNNDSQSQSTRTRTTPLHRQVIRVIVSSGNNDAFYKVRPALLATQLGLSMDDATAELCGLLSAVGSTATFSFESSASGSEPTMVFTFPRDFARRAQWARQVQWTWHVVWQSLDVLVRVLRVVVAFGILLSLTIVTIAAIMAIVGAIIALSRAEGGGGRHHQEMLWRRIRAMAGTLREVLWIYAMWGPQYNDEDEYGEENHGFFRDVAGDISMALAVCCGYPGSIFFWLRTRRWQQRRQQRQVSRSRRLRRTNGSQQAPLWFSPNAGWNPHARYRNATATTSQEQDGVALVRMGNWHREDEDNEDENLLESPRERPSQRGLLSIVVEFLFGPTPFWPGPTVVEKWKWRAQYLIQRILESKNDDGSLSLSTLLPLVDDPPQPPPYLKPPDLAAIAEGLKIVTHFHGKPAKHSEYQDRQDLYFVFPELMGEGVFASTQDFSGEEEGWDGPPHFWYRQTVTATTAARQMNYLYEQRHVLTTLTAGQFCQCWAMGIINYFGVAWLCQILRNDDDENPPSAPPPIDDDFVQAHDVAPPQLELPPVVAGPIRAILSLLRFYSLLFLGLPLARALLIALWNRSIQRRNQLRHDYAKRLVVDGDDNDDDDDAKKQAIQRENQERLVAPQPAARNDDMKDVSGKEQGVSQQETVLV